MSMSIPVQNPDERVRFLEVLGAGGLVLSAADDRDRAGTWRLVGWSLGPGTRQSALAMALRNAGPTEALHVRPYISRNPAHRPVGEALGQCCVDLDAVHPDRLRALGVEPAAVVETSPGRWQAWLRFPEPLPKAEVQRVLEGLSQELGLEAGARQALHAGRVPGFPNGKYPERPVVRLVEATGRTVDPASLARFLPRTPAVLPPVQWQPRRRDWIPPLTGPRSLTGFHADPRYDGDKSRADLAWAHYALDKMGMNPEEAARTIQEHADRDPHRTKSRRYGERTVAKAVARQGPSLSR